MPTGLWGQSVHWDTVRSYLDRLDSPTTTYHVHVSNSNQLFDTYAGIDTCGDRLCRELDELVRSEEHADAECISFIGHSMGGLITRNAVAKAYDRQTKKLVLGGRALEPTHFLSLATPHVGFADAERCPMESAWYIPFSRRLVPFVSSRVLGEAGRQFFHRDESKLILRMASHEQLEVLRAFKTRTAYGNVSGDHLVGWGNASLRDELRWTRFGRRLKRFWMSSIGASCGKMRWTPRGEVATSDRRNLGRHLGRRQSRKRLRGQTSRRWGGVVLT